MSFRLAGGSSAEIALGRQFWLRTGLVDRWSCDGSRLH